MSASMIRPHNAASAAAWNSGGRDYERISETIADAIEHCVRCLDPQPGQRVLDVATGTGWAARRVAARGATVVGVDLGSDLIEAAQAGAAAAGLEIDFRVADAEMLPFEDQHFDAVVSTFGVMFVRDPQAAAAELARVCRKGGRIGLLAWPPGGTSAGFAKVAAPYLPPPRAPVSSSPFDWGHMGRVRQLLGPAFDLSFEVGTSVLRAPSGAAVWEMWVTSYGPTKMLAASLDPERREDFKRDFIRYNDSFRTEQGVAMPREYLLTLGLRK
jgi:SAM-dependent methyltransferase